MFMHDGDSLMAALTSEALWLRIPGSSAGFRYHRSRVGSWASFH
jgi:hypothetical protein